MLFGLSLTLLLCMIKKKIIHPSIPFERYIPTHPQPLFLFTLSSLYTPLLDSISFLVFFFSFFSLSITSLLAINNSSFLFYIISFFFEYPIYVFSISKLVFFFFLFHCISFLFFFLLVIEVIICLLCFPLFFFFYSLLFLLSFLYVRAEGIVFTKGSIPLFFSFFFLFWK